MKKAIFYAVFGLLLLPSVSYAAFDTNLKYGSTGVKVTELQDLLVTESCLNVQPTGYFGLLTLAGVKCFQAKYSIVPVSGYFGILSRTQANVILDVAVASSTVAEQEETGTVVEPVQEPTQNPPMLGGGDVTPEPVQENRGSLSISGNDNLFFQVSLERYPESDVANIGFSVTPPSGWEVYHEQDECFGNGKCSSYKFLRHTDWKNATGNGPFTVQVTAYNETYTVQLKRGEEKVVY